jgi:hypothetical protein
MTTAQKIESIKKAMPGISDQRAKKEVRLLNWITKWDEVLHIMYNDYSSKENEVLPFMGFCIYIYENDKSLPKVFINNLIENN